MTMKWDSRFLRGDKLEKWITYKGTDGSCPLLLTYPDPEEWAAFWASRKGKDEDGGDPGYRQFLAKHVTDWRDIEVDGVPTPFSRKDIETFIRRDVKFSNWLLATLTDAASFRQPAGDGAPRPAGMEDQAPAHD